MLAFSAIPGACAMPADSTQHAAAPKAAFPSTPGLQDVHAIPGLSGDAIKVVDAQPGVTRASSGASDIIVRGAACGDSKYYLDGVPIPELYYFDNLMSTYNSDALASAEVYPGGFNVEYGDAVGGTIEIKGRPAKTDRWHATIDMNLIDGSALFEGPVNSQFSLLFTFCRSYMADEFDFAIKKTSKNLPFTAAPYYWGNVTRLDFHPSKNMSMFLTFFTSHDETNFVIPGTRDGSATEDGVSEMFDLKTLLCGYDQIISESLQNTLRIAYTTTSASQNMFSFFRDRVDISGPYVRDQLDYANSDRLSLTGGVDISPNQAKYSVATFGANGALSNSEQVWISDLALYVKAEYKPIEKLTLIPGVRYDYFSDIHQGEPSFRLNARYDYISGHTIKGSIGIYSQDPQPMGQAVDSVWGNPNLPPTLGTQSELGYEYKITNLINLDVQGYYNTQTNIPQPMDSISPSSDKPLNFLPIEKGKMFGLELILRHNQGKHFFGWVAYSLSKSLRNSSFPYSSSFNPGLVDQNSWYLSQYDRTHNVILLGAWKLPWAFEAGLRYQYSTGTPVFSTGYTAQTSQYNAESGVYSQLSAAPQTDHMDPFQEIGLKLEKKFTYEKWMFTAYIDVESINFSRHNGPQIYPYIYDGFENGTSDNLVIPSIGFKAEF
jgi:hypothetical protein